MATKVELLQTNTELREGTYSLSRTITELQKEIAALKNEAKGVQEYNAILLGDAKYITGQLDICQAVLRQANLLPALDKEHPIIPTSGKHSIPYDTDYHKPHHKY